MIDDQIKMLYLLKKILSDVMIEVSEEGDLNQESQNTRLDFFNYDKQLKDSLPDLRTELVKIIRTNRYNTDQSLKKTLSQMRAELD